MATASFHIDPASFLHQALHWSKGFEVVCLFQSNEFQNQYSEIQSLLAIGANDELTANVGRAFSEIEEFKSRYPHQWIPGFLSYDLKNELEDISTNHPNPLQFPDAYFFIPELLIKFSHDQVEIECEGSPEAIFEAIQSFKIPDNSNSYTGHLLARMSKEAYFHAFEQMISHIKRGDIYEANLCQEFYDDAAALNNLEDLYERLNEISPTPFSCFFKWKNKYILSASPERFLAKRGSTVISQPIKGTAARGKTEEEDEILRHNLANNPKEISENVMIVDLVRNDLTRTAIPGTVEVTEKLGVYTFKHVHQMISTISCQVDSRVKATDLIKNTFPAGSMTGAPKLSAMKLCDRYEHSRRGIYSGAIGYFGPNGDFDFNVVIRTLLYNADNQYLSFHTGSAITIDATAEHEYAECLTKASAILRALDSFIK